MALVTRGGVRGRLTLVFAVSGICCVATSIQLSLDWGVGLMILGETIIFFCTTMKQASLPYLLQ